MNKLRIVIACVVLICVSIAGAQFKTVGAPLVRRATVTSALNVSALQPGQQAAIVVVLDVAAGYHAQSHTPLPDKNGTKPIPLVVTVDGDPAIKALGPVYPSGEIVTYPALGKLSVYTGRVLVYIPIEVERGAAAGPLKISGRINFQICDDRTCFQPERPVWSISTQIVPAGQKIEPSNAELFKNFDPRIFSQSAEPLPKPGVALFGHEIAVDSYLLIFLGAFVVGIIFNIVPCVLPVVPLKILSFYEASQHRRARSLMLGAAFSLGIIATFAALALLVVVFHRVEWGQLFSNPIFTGAVVVVLVGLALQTFGAFQVILPQSIYRLSPTHETIVGNILFGAFTAILSTPCTFGMFFGLLIWAASQPGWVGTTLLMTVGAGMASPYLVLSAIPELAGKLPRSGPWAEIVKQLMGFMLLGVAVYFARRFLPGVLAGSSFWWLIFAMVIAACIFLVARTIQLSRRAFPIAVAVVIALLMAGPALAVTLRLTYVPIAWMPYTPAALEQARAQGRPVLIDFTAVWCGNCQALEATVFTDTRVVTAFKEHNILALRADVTEPNAPGWDLLRQLNSVGAIPLTAVYLPNEKQARQLSGLYSTSDLLPLVTTISSTRNPS